MASSELDIAVNKVEVALALVDHYKQDDADFQAGVEKMENAGGWVLKSL